MILGGRETWAWTQTPAATHHMTLLTLDESQFSHH